MQEKRVITEETRKKLSEAGKRGGSKKVPKGFAIMKQEDPELFKKTSSKGGKGYVKKQK